HHYWQRLRERIATRSLHVSLYLRWRKFKKTFAPPHHLELLRKTHTTAQRNYVATPISQHIFLVQSEEHANKAKHQNRWSALAHGGLTFRVVPGATHQSILAENEAHIDLLARHLQEYLNGLDQQRAR
ncbi:MAG: hypothetical protein KDE19_21705, partial [Caldilineaceae bacterium]|nr:hypothetical protein [Caldilineaceae bacterium]